MQLTFKLDTFLKGHSERLKQWLSMGFVLFILGITLHFTNGKLVKFVALTSLDMFRLTYMSLRIGSLEEFMKTIYNIFLSL
jgi:hypothetical protein